MHSAVWGTRARKNALRVMRAELLNPPFARVRTRAIVEYRDEVPVRRWIWTS